MMAKKSPQILIADDDLDDLEMLEEALIEAAPDAVISKAVGGVRAVELLNGYTGATLPDLIVLDYNMPDMSGAEVLSYINEQKRYSAIPRVVFSTSDARRHVSDCLTKGAKKYFVKPNTKRELDEIALQMLSLITPQA